MLLNIFTDKIVRAALTTCFCVCPCVCVHQPIRFKHSKAL